MKNKIILAILFAIIINIPAYAVPSAANKAVSASATIKIEDIKDNEFEVIKRFNLWDKFQKSPESQIKSFYKEFNKCSEKNDVEKLKTMYSDSYVNNDGFDKETVFEMINQSKDAYKDMEYTTTIENISAGSNYATVDLHEFAIGSTSQKQEEINDYGLVVSDLYYTDYLKKEGNKWKITATNVKSEKVALKYGETKNMPIEVSAPLTVPEGSEYDVKVTTESPNGVLVIGSIVNEQIKYPQTTKKDVFKSVKSGEIERVLKANTDNHNEYAAVTIGVTRASIEPPEVVFNMTGMAFVMSRINVYHKAEKEASHE